MRALALLTLVLPLAAGPVTPPSSGLGRLRARSRRIAPFAADADRPRQRGPARSGLDVPHRGSRRHAAARPSPRPRGHAARRRRHDVPQHALGRAIALDPATGRQRWRTTPGRTATGLRRLREPRRLYVARSARRRRRRRARAASFSPSSTRARRAGRGHRPPCAGFGDKGTTSARPVCTGPFDVRGVRDDVAAGGGARDDRDRGIRRRRQQPHQRGQRRGARLRRAHRCAALDLGSRAARLRRRGVALTWRGAMAAQHRRRECVVGDRGGFRPRPGLRPHGQSPVPTTSAASARATTATPTRSWRSAPRRDSVVWHFQTVHHDLWDYDNASPPALMTLVKDGQPVDVVLQATKTGSCSSLTATRASRSFRWRNGRCRRAPISGEARRRPSRSPR